MTAEKRKAALKILCLLGIAGIGIAGFQYYLDEIRPPALSPRRVVEEYFTALKNREFKKAYEFISLRHYNDSFNQFVDRAGMYSSAMRLEITGENIREGSAVVDVRVFVPLEFGPYSSDANMDLIRVKREWKIIHP
jgi:hypothetical protein